MSRPKNQAAKGRNTARPRRWLTWVLVGAAGIGVLGGLYGIYSGSSGSTVAGSPSTYAVGRPGPGQTAPGFTLTDTTGRQVSLADYRGKTVLLYFQEGLTCQPCWDQLTNLEQGAAKLKAAGIDAVVSITSDPANLIAQKMRDMGLTTTVLSDPGLAISQKYNANQFGMMGTSRDGHTFILVGADGIIRWRADYGGAPNYTMFVPVDTLLADLRVGVKR